MRAALLLLALSSWSSISACGRHIPVTGRGPVHALVFSGNGAFVTAITKEIQEGARLSVVDVRAGKVTYSSKDLVVRLPTSVEGSETRVPYVTAEGQIGYLEPQAEGRNDTALRLPRGVVPLSIALSGDRITVTGYTKNENGGHVWSGRISARAWDNGTVPSVGFPTQVVAGDQGLRLFFGSKHALLVTADGSMKWPTDGARSNKGAIAADGTYIALGHPDGNFTLWRAGPGLGISMRRRANTHGIVQAVTICPQAVVTSDTHGLLRFWDPKTGEQIGEKNVGEPATALACSARGTLAIGFVSPEVMLLQTEEILDKKKGP